MNILFFHQSADLYGSDKVLLDLITGLDRRKFHPILLLPCEGPLLDELTKYGIETYVVDLTRLSRATLSLQGLLSLPFHAIKSIKAVDLILGKRKIDVVHSNTVAVLTGALWARLRKVPHLWHVHEMIVKPKIVVWAYSFLLRFFADHIVCNSHATLQLLSRGRSFLTEKSSVVWNGLRQQSDIDHRKVGRFRQALDLQKNDVLVVLAGRINRWKGQALLVEAAGKLWVQGIRNVHFLFVGSPPPGQEHFKDNLEKVIKESPAKDNITISDYCSDIWTIWHACDIAVVPSTEPEPFGMVAIEAMAVGKPVVAAAHGGLTEIIEDGKTGILVEPGNSTELAKAIAYLASNPDKRNEYGENGLKRQRNIFTLEKYIDSFAALYSRMQ